MPANGKKVDYSAVDACVGLSMEETLERTRYLEVDWDVFMAEYLEGRCRSNAFFLSRKSPKFLENSYLTS
jgi:hypothetical protein